MNLLNNFKLGNEKENFQQISENIQSGIHFKGSNLWILIFAIFIASLGLNVNSTAVIIGAMLVSPLMGPIMGLGFGMAINNLSLLRKSFFSYLFAAGVGLTTSTIYFILSPLNAVHSEILARTAPNIYDVLIAFFGGLAGILATASKLKGNVIPGVAIATALMPPLCTAGYGLATWQWSFFAGASYLFIINTVFIALATLITARFLKFPYKRLPDPKDEVRSKRVVGVVVIITLLPSIYFGYDIVQQNKFRKKADQFIDNEAVFKNDYLLKKNIDAKKKTILLVYGGQAIDSSAIANLKRKLPIYDLSKASLEIRQGFAYLKDEKTNEQTTQLSLTLNEKENQINQLQARLDSLTARDQQGHQIFNELKTIYPNIQSLILQPTISYTDSTQQHIWVAIIKSKEKQNPEEKNKIENWLKIRIKEANSKILFE